MKSVTLPMWAVLDESSDDPLLSPTYIPDFLTVSVADAVMVMEWRYRFASDEKTKRYADEDIQVDVGCVTKRLFRVALNLEHLLGDLRERPTDQQIAVAGDRLRACFERIVARLREEHGVEDDAQYGVIESQITRARTGENGSDVWGWALNQVSSEHAL